jgi:hypothetical protein
LDAVVVKERSTRSITVSFSEDGAPVIPEKIYYSLYCKTTQTEILGEKELVPAGATIQIPITALQNRIINPENSRESKLLTLRWTWDSGEKQETAEYNWIVENLLRIT